MPSDYISRRSITRRIAWSIPAVISGVAAPYATASVGLPTPSGGVLHSNGAAGAWVENGQAVGLLTLNGINWNGYGAAGDYVPGSISITISLPGPVAQVDEAAQRWNIVYTVGGDTVTLTNSIVFERDSVISTNNHIEIRGAFAGGAHYRVTATPTGVEVDGVIARGDHVFATWG